MAFADAPTTMAAEHRYAEAGYHEQYSEDEDVGEGPSATTAAATSPLDGETPSSRNPTSSSSSFVRHNSNVNSEGRSTTTATTTTAATATNLMKRSLEPSWINAEPFDEFIREISEFIVKTTRGRTNVEVEAKIGVLIDTRTNHRVNLPVMSEIILAENYPDVRFEANMSAEQHEHFNRLLNGRVETTNSPSYPHARIGYSHSKVVDSFHRHSSANKLRLTVEEKSGNVKECVIKERIANINVYSPRHKVDWRVSVNTETPAQPPNSPPLHTRRKDRLTYTHQAFQIDLTQVNAISDSAKLQHELEVEFRDTEELMQLASLRSRNAEGGWAFDELVRVFVNNVRILVRNAP